MAVVTMRLKDLWRITDGHIGLDDYEIFDEAYRPILNDRIRREYWLEDIAHETPDIFIWRLNLKMDLIMPRYNRMYKAELLNNDPLDGGVRTNDTSQDGTSAATGRNEQSSTGTGEGGSKGRTVGSDTPQTRLAGNGDYASTISDATSSTTSSNRSSSTSESNNRNNYKNSQHSLSKGYSNPKSMMIAQYRSSLINVDDLIIAELSDLFMPIWNNDHKGSSLLLGGYLGYW
jgi:hypothetical protein